MSIYDDFSGRWDTTVSWGRCKHGHHEMSCAQCGVEQAERDARATEPKPYPAGMVDGPRPLTAWERECAEFDAVEDAQAQTRR
jgi:hypothetical protein